MSNVTKEWLQKTIAELEEERDAIPGAVNEDAAMALAAMKLALASLEAEPVAHIIQDADARSRGEKGILRYFANISDEDINEYQITVTPLYTAPQPLTNSERAELENYRNAQQVVQGFLRESVGDLLAVMDEYPEAIVPINRDSAVVRELRHAIQYDQQLISELLIIAKEAAGSADECAHAEFNDDSMKFSDAISEWEQRAAMQPGAVKDGLPDPIKDNQLNSGPDADDYYSGYQSGWNECIETISKDNKREGV